MPSFLRDNIEYLGLLGAFGSALLFILWKIRYEASAVHTLRQAAAADLAEPLTLHPEVDADKCSGCGACTRVCPEGDILRTIGNRAVLVSPTKCVGHGECEKACPFGAIQLVFGTKTKGFDMPRLTQNFETNLAGVYITGELGGMGLIRNAIKQGAMAARHAARELRPASRAQYDIIIVGAGPAGLAAALSAKQAGLSYLLLDQNRFGGSINSFPRQKLVMTSPADMPGFGVMKFKNNQVTKAELMEYWNQIRAQAEISVLENVRFENLRAHDDGYIIQSTQGSFTAQKVILAMGVRGSPRRLGLANEDLPKVTYGLVDPEQYHGCHITVVGGGNNAVETALMLSEPPLANVVTLVVRTKDFDRCNQNNRDAIAQRAKDGHARLLFETQTLEIHHDTLTLLVGPQAVSIPNDYLFVMIGAEMPFRFLTNLGIEIERRFGDPVKAA